MAMKRHHKILLAVGLLIALVAWLAWMLLLTESELDGQTNAMLRDLLPGASASVLSLIRG